MKIAVLGAGRIAATVSATLSAMKEVQCYAVAARDLKRAEAFAERFGFEKAYGSYEEMLADPQVELVYIATPHSHHFAHMMLCMAAGKPVICEKSFTMNAEQARQAATFAKEKGIYLAEAIWTRYMPSRAIIDQVIASGVVGKIHCLTANLSYAVDFKDRIMRPELAGGALLDVGVYGLNFALMHFGDEIERMESSVKLTETGVDAMESITLFYKDGRMAVLTHGIHARSDRKGIFYGDKGYIVVENINNPNKVTAYDLTDQPIAEYTIPQQISGYEYEFLEAKKCIREGKWQSDSMPLETTIQVMEIMDTLRRSWGVVYPQEQ
jgi:predicted dehydrogenase